MANELKFGNKVVFLNGLPMTLPIASSDPGSPSTGDLYYNSTSNTIRYYNGTTWGAISNNSLTGLTLNQYNIIVGNGSNLSAAVDTDALGDARVDTAGGIVVKAGAIDNAKVSASAAIAYSKLNLSNSIVNADINTAAAIAYSKLNLASSIVNADVAAGAAIVYSKLSLTNSILNADINSAAAIALSKLATLTANRALQSDGSGVISVSSVTSTELGYVSGVTSAIQTQINAKANSADVILKNGTVPFTGNQSMGSNKLTNVADPTTAQDAATKAYVDAVAEGLRPKMAVRVGSLANINLATALENGDTVDGITLATGDRVLVKNQTLPEENGIYIVQASGAAVRATDMDSLTPIDEINGAYTFIQSGTQAGQGWVEQSVVAVLDTDPMVWVYFNSVASIIGGDMITVTGSTIAVDLAAVSGLESSNPGNSAGQLRVKLEASNPSLRITGSNELGVKLDAAGAITSGASGLIVGVDNSTIEINTNALRLKAGGISNAHINAAAAIALTKLAALANTNRALVSDGSGFIAESSVTSTELGYVSGVTSAIQTQLNGKANTALSNLSSVAINASLIAASNMAIDLGSDAIEWGTLWAANVSHNDSGTPNMAIGTTGNNGSVIISAHGTGNLDVKATKMRRSESAASSNYMEDQYFDGITLAANTSSATEISSSLSFSVASFDSAVINYRIKEATSNKVRIGQLVVASDGTIASSSDQFSDTASLGSALGLSLSADIDSGNVRILYNNTNASNAATFRCHIRRFRA